MRVDLHAATDVAQYVLFDPAAIPEWIRHDLPFPSGPDWLEKPARQGNLLDYRDVCDGEIRARLFIDEKPEERLKSLAKPSLTGALLNVPSGKLWFIGAECLKPDTDQHATPETYLPGSGIVGTHAEIPLGLYRVSALEILPEEVESRVRDELTPEVQRLIDRFNNVMASGCLLTFLALFMVAGFAVWRHLDGRGWFGSVKFAGVVVGFVLAYWLTVWNLVRSPRYDEALAKQTAAMKNWPQLLLHFQTAAGTHLPEESTPGIFGPRPPGESRSDG